MEYKNRYINIHNFRNNKKNIQISQFLFIPYSDDYDILIDLIYGSWLEWCTYKTQL